MASNARTSLGIQTERQEGHAAMTLHTRVSVSGLRANASPHWSRRRGRAEGRAEGVGSGGGTPLGQGEGPDPLLRLLSHLVSSLIMNVSLKLILFSSIKMLPQFSIYFK